MQCDCVAEQVVDLVARRADKRDRDIVASEHPALRWVAGAAFYIAHRKVGAVTACGARGDLILAPPGVPRCVTCFPLDERPT